MSTKTACGGTACTSPLETWLEVIPALAVVISAIVDALSDVVFGTL